MDLYVDRSVGVGVDRYVGGELGKGFGSVGWYFGRDVGVEVDRGTDGGVGNGSGVDIDGGEGF